MNNNILDVLEAATAITKLSDIPAACGSETDGKVTGNMPQHTSHEAGPPEKDNNPEIDRQEGRGRKGGMKDQSKTSKIPDKINFEQENEDKCNFSSLTSSGDGLSENTSESSFAAGASDDNAECSRKRRRVDLESAQNSVFEPSILVNGAKKKPSKSSHEVDSNILSKSPQLTDTNDSSSALYSYVDRSQEQDDLPATPLTIPSRCPSFIVKLFAILCCDEYSSIVRWLPHGRSWTLIDPIEFELTLIPKYFGSEISLIAFMRRVKQWSFKRITTNGHSNSYYHEYFLRGLPHLMKKMTRTKKVPYSTFKTEKDASGNTLAEPDFYRISEKFPLSEAPHANDRSAKAIQMIDAFVRQNGPLARIPASFCGHMTPSKSGGTKHDAAGICNSSRISINSKNTRLHYENPKKKSKTVSSNSVHAAIDTSINSAIHSHELRSGKREEQAISNDESQYLNAKPSSLSTHKDAFQSISVSPREGSTQKRIIHNYSNNPQQQNLHMLQFLQNQNLEQQSRQHNFNPDLLSQLENLLRQQTTVIDTTNPLNFLPSNIAQQVGHFPPTVNNNNRDSSPPKLDLNNSPEAQMNDSLQGILSSAFAVGVLLGSNNAHNSNANQSLIAATDNRQQKRRVSFLTYHESSKTRDTRPSNK